MASPLIGDEERAAVLRVLDSGNLVQGPEVAAFEDEFAALVDGRRCVAVNSGTSALHLALLALGIGPGDEVVVPSFTFAATANAVRLAGAEPVFADIDADTFCLSTSAVEAALGPRTAAVMPVHLYGHPADMTSLCAVAARHGIAVIEDAAQAHGARRDGQPAGAWGAAAAFSFYPTKNMTTGEGGMIVFADRDAERRARLLRNQGMERQYENEVAGFNLRLTDLAAALGRVQLRRLGAFNEARRANAARLTESLDDVADLVPPHVAAGAEHVFHQYTIRHPRRDELQRALDEAGVDSRVYYPTPVHRLPAYALELGLPVTERAAGEVLSLPVAPHLSADDVDRVIEAVRKAAA